MKTIHEVKIVASKVMVAPQFEDTKSEQYRYVFASGVFGGVNPNVAQMIFYLDRPEPETVSTPHPGTGQLKKIIRELQVEVCMTPTQFKSVADWMNTHVQEYEKTFGPIVTEPAKKEKKKKAEPPIYA